MPLRIRRPSPACVFSLLFAATLAGNWGGMWEFAERAAQDAAEWKGRGYRGNGEHADAFRELAEKFVPPGATVYYCPSSHDGGLQPAERSTHLALSWARSPAPVGFSDKDGVGDASAIIVSRFLRVDFPGFRRAAENDGAVLWLREDISTAVAAAGRMAAPPPPWREAAGGAAVCALVAWFVWRKKQRPGPFFSRTRLAGLVLRSRDGCAPSRSERLRAHSATDGNLVSLH